MRKRRNVDKEFYDVFADMPIHEQDVALKILAEINRQAWRSREVPETPRTPQKENHTANEDA